MKRMRMRINRNKRNPAIPSVGRMNTSFNFIPRLVVIFTLLIISFFSLSFLRIINPFYTFNPFINDITIGETVIGSWQYGGTDPAGNLRFYHDTNGFQTVLIPPDSSQFAADGTYVLLLEHSPVSLQFETRNQYVTQLVFQVGIVLLFLVGALIFLTSLGRKPNRRSGFRARYKKR